MVRPSLLLLVAGGLLSAPGCAWQRALRQGDAAAATGDWLAALEYYDEAASYRSDDAGLKARMANAGEQAVEQLVAQAGQARDLGELYQALDLLDQAEEIEARHLQVALLREEIVGALAQGIREQLAGSEPDAIERAVQSWQPFQERFPHHPETVGLREEIGAALGERVAGLLRQQRFSEAQQQLQALREPLALDKLLDELSAAWSEHLLTKARLAERRRQLGLAWTAAASAAHLADSVGARAERDRLRAAFLAAHATVIGPRLSGDVDRVDRLEQRLIRSLGRTPDLRWQPGARGAAVSGRLTLSRPSFHQESRSTVAIHEFPGEPREHDNPARLRAQADQSAAQALLDEELGREAVNRSLRAAEQERLEGLRAGLAPVEGELAAARDALVRAENAANQARSRLDEAVGARQSIEQYREQNAALEAAVEEAELVHQAALQQLETAGGAAAGEASRQLDEARRALEQARAALEAAPRSSNLTHELARHVGARAGELAEREREVEQARRALQERQAPVQDQLDAIGHIEARIAELDGELEGLRGSQADQQRRVDQAAARVRELPERIVGPVMDRVEVEVVELSRSCEVTIDARLALPGGARLDQKLLGRASTSDQEHPGLPERDLPPDPMELPMSDGALLMDADGDAVEAIQVRLSRSLATLRVERLEAGREASDPELQLRALLLAWMVDPEPVSEELQALWREQWGLGELPWLAPSR